jgi:hypothetical protein
MLLRQAKRHAIINNIFNHLQHQTFHDLDPYNNKITQEILIEDLTAQAVFFIVRTRPKRILYEFLIYS